MSYVTNQRPRFDSAADEAELAEIDRRCAELDAMRAKIVDERRDLSRRRRRVFDRIRFRRAAASKRAA